MNAIPEPEDAQALTVAALVHFGPCSCMRHGRQVHVCRGHAFLHEDPTQRGLASMWQRLLWMRALRPALLAQEGIGSPEPTPAPSNVLPW